MALNRGLQWKGGLCCLGVAVAQVRLLKDCEGRTVSCFHITFSVAVLPGGCGVASARPLFLSVESKTHCFSFAGKHFEKESWMLSG